MPSYILSGSSGLSARGLPTQEHRLALLRPVATRRELGPAAATSFAARSARWRSPPPPNVGERRQSVDRHDLRGRAAGPRQCQEHRRPEKSYRGRQPGLAAGRAGDGRLRDDAAAAPALFARLDGQPMGRSCGCTPTRSTQLQPTSGSRRTRPGICRSYAAPRAPRDGSSCRSGGRSSGPSPGWGKRRRLKKDREKSVLSSESFIKLAMIQLMFHRLRPCDADAEFHYRDAA